MDKLEGIILGLELVDNDTRAVLPYDENGYLGNITPSTSTSQKRVTDGYDEVGIRIFLNIRVIAGMEDQIFGFMVERRNIALKANEERNRGGINNGKSYSLKIQLRWYGKHGCLQAQSSILHLLKINGDIVEKWEVSVISQAGEFFISLQKVYAWRIYNKKGRIESYDDDLYNWPQMLGTLGALLATKMNDLPGYDESRATPATPGEPEQFEDFEGRVLWWSETLNGGSGQIQTGIGPAWVHWTQVCPSYKKGVKRSLIPGKIVEFYTLETHPSKPVPKAVKVKHIES